MRINVLNFLPLNTNKKAMSNLQKVQLPPIKPDNCASCVLCGLLPRTVSRPKYSKETHVCLGTMEAMTKRGIKIKASQRDAHHPLRRPCDDRWDMWMTLPRRILNVNRQFYAECRIPYENTLQIRIKFHNSPKD